MAATQQDFSLTSVSTQLGQHVSSKQSNLEQMMNSLGDSPTAMQMLQVQQEVGEYQQFVNLQSTLIKEISDTIKGIIQKAG